VVVVQDVGQDLQGGGLGLLGGVAAGVLQDRRPRFQVVGHVAGELSTDFARDNSEQAAQLFAPDAVLEDLTLRTAVVGRQSIAAYLARALPSLPYGQGAQVRHFVGGAAGGGYEWTNPGTSAPRGVNAIKLNSRRQIVQLTSIWDGSLVTPAWITQHLSLTIES